MLDSFLYDAIGGIDMLGLQDLDEPVVSLSFVDSVVVGTFIYLSML